MIQPRELLKQFGLRPKKSLGQNFLGDIYALNQIVQAAEVNADDDVLEIGPGLGGLTQQLASIARHVIAVEIDQMLIPVLRSQLADRSNVELIHGDILELDPAALLPGAATYKVVANIPYYITSAIIRHLLEASIKPSLIVLTVQREVAERIIARPDDMNLMAVSVQFYGTPRIMTTIKAEAFYPEPNVDSAVVRIDLDAKSRYEVSNVDTFFKVVRAGFSQKRKQIHNSLVGGLARSREEVNAWLTAARIDPKRRAETLTLEEWTRLVNLVE